MLKNGGSDPDAVWHLRSDASRDEADSVVWESVHGKGTFGGDFGARHCNLGIVVLYASPRHARGTGGFAGFCSTLSQREMPLDR